MKLLTCHIENFGKLSDFSYDFTEGYNVICMQNGSGKSTFAAFLRVMFYGFSGETKRSELENERKFFKPWQGGTYGGQVTFFAKGKYYFLTRTFGETKKADRFRLQDADTLLDSTDFSENIGQELFGIDDISFKRTIYIGQDSVAEYAPTDSISAKLGNLVEDTEDINNYEYANRKLTDAYNRLSSKRSTGKISQLNRKIASLKEDLREKTVIEETISQVTCQLNQVKEEWKDCFDENKKGQDMEESLHMQKKYKGLCGVLIGIFVIGYAWFFAGNGYRFLICMFGIFSICAGGMSLLSYCLKRHSMRNKTVKKKNSEKTMEHNPSQIQHVSELGQKMVQYTRKLDELRIQYDELEEKETKLKSLQEEVITLGEKCDIIQKTLEFLAQAKQNYTVRYKKSVTEGFRTYYAMLSGEDGTDYVVNANLVLEKKEQGLNRDIRYLSRGYQDINGICMRLALIDEMYENEKPFLILDDPFVNLDVQKLQKSHSFIHKVSEMYQVIYFTCHESRVG